MADTFLHILDGLYTRLAQSDLKRIFRPHRGESNHDEVKTLKPYNLRGFAVSL